MRYVWEHSDWPNWHSNLEAISSLTHAVEIKPARLQGRMKAMGFDAGISSLDIFVKFEPFCGNANRVERPESRDERLPRRGAIRLRAMRLRRDREVASGG